MEDPSMRQLLRKVLAVLAFVDDTLAGMFRLVGFRRRVIDRTTITTGSSPDPHRRPPRR
ncbi:MAG: hypothetical protein OXG61_03715 [Chloroflexi bacterium]|nr:hypothetical protein [Chloroflexota bacterium]